MPVAATNAPMVAERPDVDTLGLVLPNLKAPHSGWPLEAHPRGSLARLSRSDHPIAVCGQPNAFAFGSGIARTIGVETTDSLSAARMSGRSCDARSWRSSCSHVDAAGDHASGAGPHAGSQLASVNRDSATPDAIAVTEIP